MKKLLMTTAIFAVIGSVSFAAPSRSELNDAILANDAEIADIQDKNDQQDNKLDNLKTRTDNQSERISTLKERTNNQGDRLDSQADRLNNQSARIDTNLGNTIDNANNIADHETRINQIATDYTTRTEVDGKLNDEALTRYNQDQALSERIDTNQNNINQMWNDSVAADAQLWKKHKNTKNQLMNNVDALKNKIGLKLDPNPADPYHPDVDDSWNDHYIYDPAHAGNAITYINDAETMVEADKMLDVALSNAVANGAAANAEHDRRLDGLDDRADNLSNRISNERQDRMDAVTDERQKRRAADNALEDRIDQEVAFQADKNAELDGRIDESFAWTDEVEGMVIDEEAARIVADQALSDRIDTEAAVNDRQRERLNNQSERINQERQDRMAAVTDERQKRRAADAELGNRIDGNTSRIETNETNISSNTSRITTNETNISNNTTAINQNSADIASLNDKVEDIEAGMAGLAALYGIPQMDRGIGVGVGSYNGHVAVAVGYQNEIDEGVHVKIGVSVDEEGNSAVSGGIGWEF